MLPAAPLLDLVPDLSYGEMSERLGLTKSTLFGIVNRQQISVYVADRVAIRLGLHPILIWGDQWLLPVHADNVARSNQIDLAFAALRQEVAS